MKQMKKLIVCLLLSLTLIASGFSEGTKESANNYTLHVYAGVGMSKPVKKVINAFEKDSNYNVDLTLANFGQIVSQMNITKSGDVFICASHQDLEVITDSVSSIDDLALHKVSFAVQKGNPKGITSLQDLTRKDVTLVIGNSSTAAGKIADKILSDFDLSDKVNIIARQAAAATIYTALERGECDAMINWKNNAGENSQIIDSKLTDKYTRIICAASLKYSENIEAQSALIKFLKSEKAIRIWESEGYERL
ncbi:MAG: substrate-binding domain-containing protein [Spirochaetaceae bacterium]|nr:substrate-binding domain-containing protein [Spirochaetaceae bacterium]